MEALALGCAWQAEEWRLQVENADERWRCRALQSPEAAENAVRGGGVDALILCPGQASETLLNRLADRPPLRAPYLIGDGVAHAALDARLKLSEAALLPALLRAREDAAQLPQLCGAVVDALMPLAAGLLRALDMPRRLGAWAFLPRMAAVCAAHPAVMLDLQHRLYPWCGEACGLKSACVERRLRLAVESTWNKGSLDALERFFGQSVDPERGKPTNKEFLARLAERLTQDAARLWPR